MDSTPDPLQDEIAKLLGTRPDESALESVLDLLLEHFDGAVATVHVLEADTHTLHLRAQRGLPPRVLEEVGVIPVGKGMAGLAAERREPVQVCNLQTDDSGVARPAARETQMEGSIALPMLRGDRLLGALGVAKPVAHEFDRAETEQLLAIAGRIGAALESGKPGLSPGAPGGKHQSGGAAPGAK